jgi:hypothetical protein
VSLEGSLWSRWDLHVHTPASYVHGYGGATADPWDAFIVDLEALPADVTTLGVNDYLTIEGYRRLLAERENGRLNNLKLLLPVVEFRIKRFAGQGRWKRVNYHVIFSNEIDPRTIEDEFLSSITSSYTLADGKEWTGPPLPQRLEELGRMVKATAPDPAAYDGPDLRTGIDSFNVEPEGVEQVLRSSAFRGKYMTAIGKTEWDALSWSKASAAEKRSLIARVDFLFTACGTLEEFTRSHEVLQANFAAAELRMMSLSIANDSLRHCFRPLS